MDWLQAAGWLEATSYESLWEWSVTRPEAFWASLVDYFGVQLAGVGPVLAPREMPFAEWFPGRRLNYVDTVISHAESSRPAIIDDSEPGGPGARTVSWAELARQVTSLSNWLRDRGVGEGDCVVGYLPNVAEAVIAFGLLPRASERPGRAAVRTINPKPSSTASDSSSRGPRRRRRLPLRRQARSPAPRVPSPQAGLPTLREVLVVRRSRAAPSCPAGMMPWVEAVARRGRS